MKYGYFSRNGKEYTITRPDTPRPWFNYLFNDLYHAIISHTGGGFSYARDPKFNRILNYENYSSDRPGRYFYIRDNKTGKFWAPNWQPICDKLERWQCRHGFGYTRILAQNDGLQVDLTYFVPLHDMAEHVLFRVVNSSDTDRDISIFPFYDIVAGDISLELLYPNIMPLYNRSFFNEDQNTLYLNKLPTSTRAVESMITITSTAKIDRFDTSREAFLGRYGTLAKPQVLVNGSCANSIVSGERMVAVLQHNISLQKLESFEMAVSLNFYDTEKQYEIFKDESVRFIPVNLKDEIDASIGKAADLEYVKKQYNHILNHWETKFRVHVDTPDDNINLMANNWLQYQLTGITHWRGSSPYHGAEGGLGYRDTAQDVEGLLSLDLELARSKMIKLLRFQYKTGHAVSGFSDIEGPWDLSPENIVAGKSDVAVWIVFTVISYLKETGDFNFLELEYPFLDGEKASVKAHILRAVRYLYNTTGKNSLPLIMKADWNDAYDRIGANGQGESVWLAMALARALKQCSELFGYLRETELCEEMEQKYSELKNTINDCGWEENWYLAAFSDDGYKVGSSGNTHGKMPLNSQTWAILSEIVPPNRLEKILEIIDSKLDTEYGPALFSPAYTQYNDMIGRVTAFAEGTKENAAVFSHAAAFKIVADCMLGRGNRAYDTFSKLMPIHPNKASNMERYKAEPYVIAEYVIGPGHPYAFGQGEFTWNTGTVPWLYIALTEWIFGVRRAFSGLLIDPCIPENWDKCSIIRPFRGDIYSVTIENPDHVEKGIREITMDNKKLSSNVIPPVGDKKVHKIRVLMG